MKIPASRRQHGFTLVELLVVIAIIAVLAAAGFAAGNAAIQKAKKVTALSSATALESAVNNFFNEYNYMPQEGTSDSTVNTKNGGEGVKLLTVLLGLEPSSGANTLNTRAVKFLSAKEGKSGKNGLIYNTNGTSVSGLYDPWGGGFYVMLDLDFDEKLNTNVSGVTTVLNGRRVAVWSLGADGVSGTGGKAGDDVKTF